VSDHFGVRSHLAREKILETLKVAGRPMCTPQIRDAVCTPREQLFGPFALPYEQQIWSTTVYPALVSLLKQGAVGRLPRSSATEAVWWHLVSDPEQPVEFQPVEVEAVDLDALQAEWTDA